jgi:hypothetical protein
MDCAHCANFRRTDRGEPDLCTLFPEWREVSSLHYCGQFRIGERLFWEFDQRDADTARGQLAGWKARARHAESRLKKANSKIRALKQEPTGA